MLKGMMLAVLIAVCFYNARSQSTVDTSTTAFAAVLKKLIALNSTQENILNFGGQEAVSLLMATGTQIVEITAPYHHSEIKNAKAVCFHLLSQAIFEKQINQQQKLELVEILCRNYLATDHELQTNDNVLLQLGEKDFTANARKCIAALADSVPSFNYGVCARLSAVAQIKENIPVFRRYVNRDIYTMQKVDLDVLASLARMDDTVAAELLCTYYNSEWNKRERSGVVTKYYVGFAKQLAFSLNRTVLDCLVADFRNFDLAIKERGSDYFWWPAQYLGIQIVSMLKNYPYPGDYQLDPYQLLQWLNENPVVVLNEK